MSAAPDFFRDVTREEMRHYMAPVLGDIHLKIIAVETELRDELAAVKSDVNTLKSDVAEVKGDIKSILAILQNR